MAEASSSDDLLPPLLPVTADDHAAWLITTSLILLILTALATITAVTSRIRMLRTLPLSDVMLTISCILFIAQSACIIEAAMHGIGRQHHLLRTESFTAYNKNLRAGQLLAVPVLAGSKAAVLLLVLSLKPFQKVSFACKIVLGFIGVWAMAALITLGLQCDHGPSWSATPERYTNQHVMYVGLGVVHILLDVAVIVLPVALLSKVQIQERRRYQIAALFILRILVPNITVPGLLSLRPYFHAAPQDRPWNALMPAVWLQLVQSASLVSNCIPPLRRVLADLQTGMMGGMVTEFFELSVSGVPSSHTADTAASKTGSEIGHRARRSRRSKTRNSLSAGFTRNRMEVERRDSQRNLRDDVIVQTIDYEVRYDGGQLSRASSQSPERVSD